jgi:hypothetical protein
VFYRLRRILRSLMPEVWLDDLQKVKLICGNTNCEAYEELKAVIDGKATY